jgi:phosphoglycolate phosphatase
MYKTLLFDLDGTLTDSSEGITKCAQLALNHFNKTGYSLADLRVFIGPPLNETFARFGLHDQEIEEAIQVFRSRYNTVGKFENKPYPHVIKTLKRLKATGTNLYVATSKPEKTAKEILAKFEMTDLFDMICGASFDHSREKKADVISYLLSKAPKEGKTLMIGDTTYDIKGANALSLPSIGVNWGFGNKQDMLDAGALTVVNTMDELYDFATCQ